MKKDMLEILTGPGRACRKLDQAEDHTGNTTMQ